MQHDRRSWCGSLCGAVLAVAGCWVLTGCSLLTSFDRERDPTKDPDIEEHDAAATTPEDEDAAADEEPPDPADAATDPAVSDGAANSPADAGSTLEGGAMPGTEPGVAPSADSGAEIPGADASATRPSTGDLIDAVGGARDDRTDKICSCPGAGQGCVRAGFGKSACLERGIMLLSGTQQEGVRALLECMLPAEQAYTECVNTRLNCRNVEASTSACGVAYELATTRCNVSSLQGLSLQGLCSR